MLLLFQNRTINGKSLVL